MDQAAVKEGCKGAVLLLKDDTWAFMSNLAVKEVPAGSGTLMFDVHTVPSASAKRHTGE